MSLAVMLVVLSQTGVAPRPIAAGLESARALVGKPYQWGGRLRKGEGVDCMGVVLAAAERASGCGWRSFSVKPTELVAQRTWGAPVPGFSPVSTEALDVSALGVGDVLLLVGPVNNPAEPAIGRLEGVDVWVWHVGLFLGNGLALFGDHHAGLTIITPLTEYLHSNHSEYSGVFVLRGPATAPARCRRHAPLGAGR
jgi:hypothetical protein